MIATIVSSPTFAAFIFASVVLAITPGPGALYIVTRTLSQGRKARLASVGGIALGNLGNAAAASVGLAATCTDTMYALTASALAPAMGRRYH
jgi:threonine/homoserine/homoserine lactone efflux protein